ncbi:MAG: DDE-type integrase/transposase/recombinase [Bacillota bacterium]
MVRILKELGWTQKRIKRGKRIKNARPGRSTAPNQLWQIDMTKVAVEDAGRLHHIAIIDAYTREIVGHHESLRAWAGEWLEAFHQAILDRLPDGSRGQAGHQRLHSLQPQAGAQWHCLSDSDQASPARREPKPKGHLTC